MTALWHDPFVRGYVFGLAMAGIVALLCNVGRIKEWLR